MPQQLRHDFVAACVFRTEEPTMDVSETVAQRTGVFSSDTTGGATLSERDVRTAGQLPGRVPASPQEEKAASAHYDVVLCFAAHRGRSN